jgi:hypothetical protein
MNGRRWFLLVACLLAVVLPAVTPREPPLR